MRPEIEIIAGCLILSLVITYAWWIHLRVWFFRQDLFAIRDELWDAVRAKGALDDPAHRDLRDAINSLIRIAPFLSLLTVIKILVDKTEIKPVLAENLNLSEITDAREKVFRRVVRFLLFETFSGWYVVAGAYVFGIAKWLRVSLKRRVEWLVDSREFQTIDRHLSLVARKRPA